jgi:DNA-directed RNA polymerase subunit RPC12/RpoP
MSTVNYLCLKCEQRLTRATGEPARVCEHCGAETFVTAPPDGAIIDRCAACGHEELYFQKDFNRTTGIALVAIGAVFVPWTWGLSLLGVTILDYIVWRMVKDVIVCYQCQAVHRGYPANPALQPFDLIKHDQHVYGQAPPGAEEKHS